MMVFKDDLQNKEETVNETEDVRGMHHLPDFI